MTDSYAYVVIVSGLALLVYYYTLFRSGTSRAKYKVDAPAHSGPPEYERIVRVHQNTVEHLVAFLPGMWLFAYAVDPLWAAGIGLIWPIARLWYAFGYYQSADKRLPGLLVSLLPVYIFLLGSVVGGVLHLI